MDDSLSYIPNFVLSAATFDVLMLFVRSTNHYFSCCVLCAFHDFYLDDTLCMTCLWSSKCVCFVVEDAFCLFVRYLDRNVQTWLLWMCLVEILQWRMIHI